MKAIERNLYFGPEGVYYADFTISGRRIRKSLRTTDKKEARAELKRLLRAARLPQFPLVAREKGTSGDFGRGVRPVFGAAIDDFVDNSSFGSGCTLRNLKTYRTHVKRLCRDWEDLRPVRVWKLFCAEGEPKPAPMEGREFPEQRLWDQPRKSAPNQLLWFMRGFVSYAHERGWVDGVLVKEVDRIPLKVVPPRRVTIPSPALVSDFLAMCIAEDIDLGEFVSWIAFSALRLSGAAGVRWEEIDFERAQYRRVMKGGLEVYIPLLPEAATLLRRRAERMGQRRQGLVWQLSDRRIKTVRRMMKRFALGLGIGLSYPHALRHHLASVALAAGLSAAEVALMLGHRDGGALVLRAYGHVVRPVLDAKVSKLRIAGSATGEAAA